jgi:NADPH-dependent ferric siderophore reductase
VTKLGIQLREETPRRAPRRLTVLGTRQLGPRLRRITLGGPDMAGFPARSEGSHIKLFFPREGQRALTLPTFGEQGVVWPAPALRPIVRTYSVSKLDLARAELSVDFVLHADHGPAARWAACAQAGDELGVAGPGGPNPMLGPAAFYLLVGDLSALPAISALLGLLPREAAGHVLLEVPTPEDMIALHKPVRVVVQWLFRRAHEPSSLESHVSALSLAPAASFAWVAGESSAVVAIRDLLLYQRGFSRAQLYATPYWREQQTEEQYHAERHRIMDELAEAAPLVRAVSP